MKPFTCLVYICAAVASVSAIPQGYGSNNSNQQQQHRQPIRQQQQKCKIINDVKYVEKTENQCTTKNE